MFKDLISKYNEFQDSIKNEICFESDFKHEKILKVFEDIKKDSEEYQELLDRFKILEERSKKHEEEFIDNLDNFVKKIKLETAAYSNLKENIKESERYGIFLEEESEEAVEALEKQMNHYIHAKENGSLDEYTEDKEYSEIIKKILTKYANYSDSYGIVEKMYDEMCRNSSIIQDGAKEK